jgi:hypothetical protein
MTDQKRGRGRPKGSGKKKEVAISPEETTYEGGRDVSYLGDETPQFMTKSPLESMVEVLQDVEMAKNALAKLKSRPATYDPYQNPRFNSKNGLDKK